MLDGFSFALVTIMGRGEVPIAVLIGIDIARSLLITFRVQYGGKHLSCDKQGGSLPALLLEEMLLPLLAALACTKCCLDPAGLIGRGHGAIGDSLSQGGLIIDKTQRLELAEDVQNVVVASFVDLVFADAGVTVITLAFEMTVLVVFRTRFDVLSPAGELCTWIRKRHLTLWAMVVWILLSVDVLVDVLVNHTTHSDRILPTWQSLAVSHQA